jgi:hypothetical protein
MTTLAPRSETRTDQPDEVPDALIAQVKANGYGVLPDALTAGEDPYAWRGVDDVVGMHVRPDGDGGCGR